MTSLLECDMTACQAADYNLQNRQLPMLLPPETEQFQILWFSNSLS